MSSNVIQFPLSLDVLIRQLEIADRESRRLKEQVDQLKAELENLQGELIEALNGGTELSTTEEAELQRVQRVSVVFRFFLFLRKVSFIDLQSPLGTSAVNLNQTS